MLNHSPTRPRRCTYPQKMQVTNPQARTGKRFPCERLNPLCPPGGRESQETPTDAKPLLHCNRADGKFSDPREAISINKWPTASHAVAAALPPVLSDARPQIHAFQRKIQSLAAELLELIALALDLPVTTFTRHHDASTENFDNFELMHYPPISPTSQTSNTAAPRFRISPHTDWGTLTLLFQSNVGGLQVRPPHYTDPTPSLSTETWTSAPAFSDKILINIGDMLEFWTAGKLKSTWHRVVPTLTEGRMDRYTFAYFLHPDRECVLVPMEGMGTEGEWVPRYEGVGRTAEEHIHARIRGVHGWKGEGKEGVETVVGRLVEAKA